MDKEFLNGDFLSPIQLLNNQKYDGHKSLHDEEMADSLGFSGAPIEGCTHLSQFVPLLEEIFKDEWFVSGCISVHYKNMVFEGERVKAFARLPDEESKITDIWMEKEDGTIVLTGSAGIGPNHKTSSLDNLMSKLDKTENHLQMVCKHDAYQRNIHFPNVFFFSWFSLVDQTSTHYRHGIVGTM